MIAMITAIAELFVLSDRSVHMETGLKQRRRPSGYENVAKKMNFRPFKLKRVYLSNMGHFFLELIS